MEPTGTATGQSLEAIARAYLTAFEERRLDDCMAYFGADSTVDFMGQFHGLASIEEWHQARFAADLKMIRLDSVEVKGNEVIVEAVATSARLRAWKVKSINGRVTAVFDGTKIKTLIFSLRT